MLKIETSDGKDWFDVGLQIIHLRNYNVVHKI